MSYSLGEIIPSNKLVRKILSVLPVSWESKNKDNERRDPKREKNLVRKKDNNDSSGEDADMAYLTKRFQKMVHRNGDYENKFKRKDGVDNIMKQALDSWGDSSSKSGEGDDQGDNSMMAVESDAAEYDSIFALPAKSDEDEEDDVNDEVFDTRPSCAKVKVEVNLLATLPQRIKIIEEADETGPEESKWIKIKYDYMPKYCKTCNKQGQNGGECLVIHPELHKKFNEEGDDQGKEKEVVARSDVIRTATNTSKVLSSGKVLGKHIPNPAKQEWMQRRNNRFHRDKNGHIIEAASQNEGDKLKGKAKEYEIVTKNSFDGLEVEESDKTILRITEGKGEENSKDKSQEKGKDQAKKGKEKENLNNSENPNHTSNGSGSREAGKEGIPNPKGEGINKLQDLIHVKKEAVEKVLEKEKSGNHSPTPTGKGTKAAINGVGDGCINIFDGSSPGLLAMGGIEEDVNMKFRDDTMESYQKIGKGKGSDPNGTVFSAQTTTVFPELGSVYELQFKIMQAIVSSMEQNKGNEHAKEQFEQAIVPRSAEEVKAVPMACESGTDQIIQLQLNVSLKTPF
ncbi:PREDICTED: uncharacterized protein LOC109243329 [Nicotiana attenuata]|uniref:uncharacterized protein LOC109243329 n=1 Tax=Nicotiana attenuata TaxID=49451 RepID=UPI000905B4C8|nr:PREDICTED: uncharacterized protein LOC109243329 [Nicotiana attenuata]